MAFIELVVLQLGAGLRSLRSASYVAKGFMLREVEEHAPVPILEPEDRGMNAAARRLTMPR